MQVLYGHTGAVRCGRFTPDGKTIVTGGGEGDATLKVWDPKSGTCTGTIQGHGFHTAGTHHVSGGPPCSIFCPLFCPLFCMKSRVCLDRGLYWVGATYCYGGVVCSESKHEILVWLGLRVQDCAACPQALTGYVLYCAMVLHRDLHVWQAHVMEPLECIFTCLHSIEISATLVSWCNLAVLLDACRASQLYRVHAVCTTSLCQAIITCGMGRPAGLTSLDVSADSTVVITGSEDMTATISNLHTGKVLGTFQGTQHALC